MELVCTFVLHYLKINIFLDVDDLVIRNRFNCNHMGYRTYFQIEDSFALKFDQNKKTLFLLKLTFYFVGLIITCVQAFRGGFGSQPHLLISVLKIVFFNSWRCPFLESGESLPKRVINHSRTQEKLHCKGEPKAVSDILWYRQTYVMISYPIYNIVFPCFF